MSFRSTAFRLAAVFLLLLAGGEVFACGFTDDGCEIGGSSIPDDGCLCCCRHVVVIAPVVFVPTARVEFAEPPAEAPHPCFFPSKVYHPPRA